MTYGGQDQGAGGAASWLDEPNDPAAEGIPTTATGAPTMPSGPPGVTASTVGAPATSGTAADGAPQPAASRTAPSGWVAPLKPGLIPLRPLLFGEILSASFRLLRTSPGVTVGSSIIILSVTSIVAGLVTGVVSFVMFDRAASASAADRPALEATAMTVTLLTAFATVILSLVGTAIMQGILAHVVARATLGEKVTFRGAWRAAFKRFWPLLGYTAIISLGALIVLGLVVGLIVVPVAVSDGSEVGAIIATLLGLLLYAVVLVGFLALGAKLLFAPSAIVLERLGPIAGLRRSWRLTRRHFWRIVGITLLVQLIASTAAGAVSSVAQVVLLLATGVLVPLGVAGEGQEWLIIAIVVVLMFLLLALQIVVSALALVLTAGNGVILYLDVRMRKEGLNIHLERAREAQAEGREPADPFTAPPIELREEQVPRPRPAYVPPAPQYGYAPQGYAPPGYAPQGYAPPGYAPPGYAPPGYAPPGYAPPGYAPQGNTPPGYSPQGNTPPVYAPQSFSSPGLAPPASQPTPPADPASQPIQPTPPADPASQPTPPSGPASQPAPPANAPQSPGTDEVQR